MRNDGVTKSKSLPPVRDVTDERVTVDLYTRNSVGHPVLYHQRPGQRSSRRRLGLYTSVPQTTIHESPCMTRLSLRLDDTWVVSPVKMSLRTPILPEVSTRVDHTLQLRRHEGEVSRQSTSGGTLLSLKPPPSREIGTV